LQTAFTVIGADAPPSLVDGAPSEVHFTGWIEQAEPWFHRARVFVAPLRYGAGMKGKVGQAMALGLPVVTTSIGAEGMELTDGGDALIRDDPEAFAAAVIRLHEDATVWQSLSRAAQDTVRRRWTPDIMRERLHHVIDDAAAARVIAPASAGSAASAR
jgi:glycosyltransferase involved in cell wall biosynthesis